MTSDDDAAPMNAGDRPDSATVESATGDAGRVRIEAVVRGLVQGVGFRYFVLRQAERRGLTGWVANATDGSVELLAEGSRFELEGLADALAVGPSGAHVSNLELRWSRATGGFDRFAVRAGGHSGD